MGVFSLPDMWCPMQPLYFSWVLVASAEKSREVTHRAKFAASFYYVFQDSQ